MSDNLNVEFEKTHEEINSVKASPVEQKIINPPSGLLVLCILIFLCLMVLCTFGAQIKRTEFHVYFWENDVRRKVYYDMAYLISQVEKAGVFNAWGCGNGIETLPDALPGSKHWIYQLGSTEEMHDAHVEELVHRFGSFLLSLMTELYHTGERRAALSLHKT